MKTVKLHRLISGARVSVATETEKLLEEQLGSEIPISGGKIEIFGFECRMSSEDVVREMDDEIFSTGFLGDLLVFWANNPTNRKIISLGSKVFIDGKFLPVHIDNGKLDIEPLEGGWDPSVQFIGVETTPGPFFGSTF